MTAWLIAAALVFAACLYGWWRQLSTRNAATADVVWSWGIAGCALLFAATGDGHWANRLFAGLLGGLWYLRLGTYIHLRVSGDAREEGRYRAMREHFGARADAFFLFFFLGQGVLALLFALPAWLVANTATVQPLAYAAAALLALLAFAGESLADAQLQRHRGNPANRGITCRSGLWRYSRHPNYFFEWLHWWAWPLVLAPSVTSLWLCTFPVLMLLFLWYITGIPWTELQATKTRGDDYRRYQQETSVFIPWFPRRPGAGA